jgi:hypothetical protein
MTQPNEAVGGDDHVVAAELTPEDRLNAAFADPANQQEKEEDEPAEGLEGEQPEGNEEAEDEPELEAEDDDLPPIDAPVSWDAEAKEMFKSLPREAQEIVQKREAERERFVQSKAQEAARARQEVEQAAIQQLAEVERDYAQHFQSLAEQLQPQRPNPAMLQYDPQAFYAQQAQYEATIAQQRELQQRSQEFAQQAKQREQLVEQAAHHEQVKVISENFPEYLDPTTGPKLQQELSAVARELGYPPELIAEARAPDILAMRKAAEWKAKAEKLDRLNAKQMEKVRAAKGMPKVAKPGTAQAPGAVRQAQYATDREAMRSGDKDAERRVLDSFFQPKK